MSQDTTASSRVNHHRYPGIFFWTWRTWREGETTWTGAKQELRKQGDIIYEEIGEKPFLPSLREVRAVDRAIARIPRDDDEYDAKVGKLAIEDPAERIVNVFLKQRKEMQARYNCRSISFGTLGENFQPLAPYPGIKHPHPDGVVKAVPFSRKHSSCKTRPIFVYAYRPPDEVPSYELTDYLENHEDPLNEVAEDVHQAARVLGDDEISVRISITEAILQVYGDMWHCGVRYGYVCADNSILFLYIREKDPDVLYHHHVWLDDKSPDSLLSGMPDWDQLFDTPVSQIASFCLLALMAKPLTNHEYEFMLRRTSHRVWPNA